VALDSTKRQLVKLLYDADTKVIALVGKWGTGKSHLWNEVKSSSGDDSIQSSLYTSLFGLSTIQDVKIRLIQSALSGSKKDSSLWKNAQDVFKTVIKALEGFHKSFGTLADVGVLLAPPVLRGKLIVLDDIERKHEGLNIEEVLGFIDEFSQRYESRFVLILNSDQLSRRDAWNVLREKVIDEELQLSTTCAEAFEIAIKLTSSPYSKQIASAAEKCGLTNIRIIRKKVVNRITEDHASLSDAVLARTIPSIVLLSAIHYNGIEDGPDTEFVLSHGSGGGWQEYVEKENPQEKTPEEKQAAQWRHLLSSLHIFACDEFELLVVEYLRSGLFDATALKRIISRYISEANSMVVRAECNSFMERSFWDHTLTEEQLLTQSRSLVEKSHLMDPSMVTSLCSTLAEFSGGQELGDKAIDIWLENFKAQGQNEELERSAFRRKLHPKIEQAFQQAEERIRADTSIIDACKYIAQHSGWGPRQEFVLNRSTAGAMESALREAPIQDLPLILGKMIELTENRGTYAKHFGPALESFVEACCSIVNDPASQRFANIIRHLFREAGLTSLLPVNENANLEVGESATNERDESA
jgi:hypothetical protein